jgi:general secretion pathway protein L
MTIAAENHAKGARALVGQAIGWWLTELRALHDDAKRRFDPGTRNAVVIEAGERYWILRQRQQPLGQIDRATADAAETRRLLQRAVRGANGHPAIMVEIPRERALVKRVSLPAAAANDIARMMQFEIARHFPFPAERVILRHRTLASAARHDAIEVELVAVPRDLVEEICRELDAAGLRPRGIAVAGAPGDLPLALPGERRAMLSRRDRWLVCLLALLAAAALAAPIVHDRTARATVERDIDALAPRVQAIIAARDRSEREAERVAAPLRLRAARPPLVAVLDALTKAVPDGSWLLSLGISGREIVVDGLSPSAATTALALEKSGAFANVVFRSPITRDPASGLEHFQLSAAIAAPPP